MLDERIFVWIVILRVFVKGVQISCIFENGRGMESCLKILLSLLCFCFVHSTFGALVIGGFCVGCFLFLCFSGNLIFLFSFNKGIPTDVRSFKFFMWVIVPVIVFVTGYVFIYVLDRYNGVAEL